MRKTLWYLLVRQTGTKGALVIPAVLDRPLWSQLPSTCWKAGTKADFQPVLSVLSPVVTRSAPATYIENYVATYIHAEAELLVCTFFFQDIKKKSQ